MIFLKHFVVIDASVPFRAGRAEILVEAFTAPSGFDDQNRRLESISNDMSELEFWSDVMTSLVSSKTDIQGASFHLVLGFVSAPYIGSRFPPPVLVDQVADKRSGRILFQKFFQSPLAPVVVLGMI